MSKIIDFIESILEKIKRIGYKNEVDYQYIKLVKKILKEGVYRQGRNGGTFSIFSAQIRFDLSKGLPLLTTKKVLTRSVIHELIWMLKGDISAKYLKDNKVGIWDLWIDEHGNLPNTYPMLWRHYPNPEGSPVDQIAKIIDQLKKDPSSRRIILSAWHSGLIETAALPPCHNMAQFYVENNKLSCLLIMRSSDFALGAPFNFLQYALLTHLIAHVTGYEIGELIWTGGDVHIYENQAEIIKEQFKRKSHPLAQIKINPNLKSIDDVKFEDIEIINYVSEEMIKMPVSK